MTLGASTMPDPATAAITPLAVTMNLRRSVVTLPSPCHELLIGPFGHVIPGADQRLELRERRVDLSRHGRLLGFLSQNLALETAEVAQHGSRKLKHFDLALELSLEPLERDGVLRVIVRESVHLNGSRGVIERPPQVDRQSLVCLLVERELVHR